MRFKDFDSKISRFWSIFEPRQIWAAFCANSKTPRAGVRLKGYDVSLKRSGKTQLPDGVDRPKYIGTLETLNIFGIRADYMAEFRKHLEEEGLPVNDDRKEFLLPVIKNLGKQPLKMIRLKKTINGVSTEFGDAFRRLGPIPAVTKPDPQRDNPTSYLQNNKVVLNWYPMIKAIKSSGAQAGCEDKNRNSTNLTQGHIAFFNIDRIRTQVDDRFESLLTQLTDLNSCGLWSDGDIVVDFNSFRHRCSPFKLSKLLGNVDEHDDPRQGRLYKSSHRLDTTWEFSRWKSAHNDRQCDTHSAC